MGWLLDWLTAFALTQLFEVGVYLRVVRRPSAERWAIALGASAITHPIAWFVIHEGARVAALGRGLDSEAGSWIALCCAEVFAVTVEALWLGCFGVRHALLWSLVANGASVLLGGVARQLLGL